MGVTIISHNVQGFNSPHKRKKAFPHYKRLKADIILLQETHFAANNHPKYFDRTYSQLHYTTFTNKTRGVAIFVRNSIIFDVQKTFKDPEGSFIILKGSINNRAITIASVYAPNESQYMFFVIFF